MIIFAELLCSHTRATSRGAAGHQEGAKQDGFSTAAQIKRIPGWEMRGVDEVARVELNRLRDLGLGFNTP